MFSHKVKLQKNVFLKVVFLTIFLWSCFHREELVFRDQDVTEDTNAADIDVFIQNLCDENEHVSDNICESCQLGTTNEAGDDALGENTVCDLIYCAEDEYVAVHACFSCEMGKTNNAGDDASGADTFCDPGFVRIPRGGFSMGSPDNEESRGTNEGVHQVTLTHDFYMQTTEVTQQEWEVLMGNNPSFFSNGLEASNRPLEQVTWHEALSYANALSIAYDLDPCFTIIGTDVTLNSETIYDCEGYRLPTEAEWEYAARAGSTTSFYNGDDPDILEEIAWYESNSSGRTHSVGQKIPNLWNLYDMSGNVWEWTWNWFGDYENDLEDPTGPITGSSRIIRGGSHINEAGLLRSAQRFNAEGNERSDILGFRLVRSVR